MRSNEKNTCSREEFHHSAFDAFTEAFHRMWIAIRIPLAPLEIANSVESRERERESVRKKNRARLTKDHPAWKYKSSSCIQIPSWKSFTSVADVVQYLTLIAPKKNTQHKNSSRNNNNTRKKTPRMWSHCKRRKEKKIERAIRRERHWGRHRSEII